MADRWGRRDPAHGRVVFYSVVEVLSGFAPNYASFLVLRALFGIGMGGEWGIGASLAMEKVPPRLRGVFSGLLQQGYAAGYLLAALASRSCSRAGAGARLLPRRVARALGALCPGRRHRIGRVATDAGHKHAATSPGTWPATGWLFAYLVLFMALMNGTSHGTQDLYPTFWNAHAGSDPVHAPP